MAANKTLASLSTTRTFTLNIHVTDLQTQKSIEVNQESHVGFVMLEIVEKLDVTADYSDHALWWPEKKIWMQKPRLSLASYGMTYDTQLQFTPQHKSVRLQMPDLQILDMRVNFAVDVFHTVSELCAELGIRHPEELSLMRPFETGTAKKRRKGKKGSGSVGSDETGSQGSVGNGTLNRSTLQTPTTPAPTTSPVSTGGRSGSDYSYSSSDALNPYTTALSPMLAHSPNTVTPEQLDGIGRGKPLVERATFNTGWFASSESLMQQGVKEYDNLLLRFKYYNFFDLNPKIDEVRINQIYEQAKWQVLTEEIECTEEEAITFAALQFQVKVAAQNPQNSSATEEVDDIESALNELQMTLEGTSQQNTSTGVSQPSQRPALSHIPEMKDNLNLIKSKSFGMKSVKSYYFLFKDTHISYYKQQSESMAQPIQKFNLKGCEVFPEVNISKDKYHIKLRIPGPDMFEVELGCNSPEQYVKWMAACRLASKGKTMADNTYEMEMSGVRTFLSMQSDGGLARDDTDYSLGEHAGMQPEDFVPQRILSKYKSKQIAARILESHSSFTKLGLLETKMNFIRQWQSLPDFGITKFNARFRESKKKQEIVGIGTNKITRFDVSSRQVVKQWRYSSMKNWNVNWETREMIISCEGDNNTVIFSLVGGDIRLAHEFIGGYIFLSMRKDVNAPLDDEMFYKLTGGWNTIGGGEGKDWSSKPAL
ncbi:fermitin family homolog 2-like [Hydractinia symbiolongicarpus]|uniref:fermitin family homolog 2-like n=1 Tax=Hydractinia symbiolongicarpus TaxID=13093 RepID=UPI00254FBC7E|nr:fermitin family homolog 2-like [Hydractinia symbiolongicarpus]